MAIGILQAYAEAVKEAPEYCRSLLSELTSTQDSLSKLRSAVVQEADLASFIPQLENLYTTLNEVLGWLKEVEPGKMNISQRISWQKHQKKVEKFRGELLRFNVAINLNLSISVRYEIDAVVIHSTDG